MSSPLNSPASNPQLTEQLRAQLRDVHLPEPITWWPPALGWWLLAGVIVLGLAALFWVLRQHWQTRRYRRFLVAQLDAQYAQWQRVGNTSHYCQNANQILKRCMANPTTRAASLSSVQHSEHSVLALTGDAWISALEARYQPLSTTTRTALTVQAYQPEARIREQVDVPTLHAELQHWLLRHKLRSAATPPYPRDASRELVSEAKS